jgi:hypothetical protein
MELIWGKGEAIYFCRAIWTRQITLKGLVKFELWRSGLPRHSGAREARARNPLSRAFSGEIDSGLVLRTPRNDCGES